MTPERINTYLSSPGWRSQGYTRECFERVSNMSDQELERLRPVSTARGDRPPCSEEARLEQSDRRARRESVQVRLHVAVAYAVLGSALGYVVAREAADRGREGAAAGAAIAAIAGFIASKGVRSGGSFIGY